MPEDPPRVLPAEPPTLAPAYYATRARGLRRDVWAVLHPPYTAWHLSYVLIGASLVPLVAMVLVLRWKTCMLFRSVL